MAGDDKQRHAKYAELQDVATALGRSIDQDGAEGRQMQYWLDKAERKVRSRVPLLDEWASQDPAYKDTVKDVLVSAVERKALNPEGLRSVMTQVDDGNIQQTIDSTRSTGEIIILDEEWEQLLRIDNTGRNSIQAQMDPVYVPLPSYPYAY
ncbi:hypothetical protein J3T92_02155 [Bifidobacterium sp. B4081]|uniref:Gp19/Gp15/Gp42 family protein n=1 Tax=unclassified Bifidobacterium TaxID=2608897 RepID=UPI00226A0DF4|nr:MULTISPECIES: Gp19/Gp15/Gp42 family protein [unclassified Bifidobacterium]MCX8643233.1 hypothetical protein [Bifidobacterium sp. B4077]MCX8645415.1 hypothetical protein [Bifidobacterium sp. B4081]MCX8668874.1 hypothetical protein [Bifidobacterium sp. B3998]